MFFIFVTCFSFIFLFRYSLPIKPLPSWACEMRLLSFYFWEDLSILKKTLSVNFNSHTNNNNNTILTTIKNKETLSLLDLPNLALECILEKLEPDGLCKMACVSTYLRDMCLSDHLWEAHMKKRWGRIIDSATYKEWQLHKKDSNYFLAGDKGSYFSKLWPIILVNHDNRKKNKMNKYDSSSVDSIVSCYRALETGKFWFPAQIFNRENGHVGFMLSCYDADLNYDPRNDTFQARYPPHGRRAAAIETGITWDRLRAPPIHTSPHRLHYSSCLDNLRPKDHIEIQWRRNKQFPYGWWYGVVGHLEACDGNDSYCHCHESDTLVLEFKQYAPGSRWRHTMINRRDHREEGNEVDGFYGGIRKLNSKDEISVWQQFWPDEILE